MKEVDTQHFGINGEIKENELTGCVVRNFKKIDQECYVIHFEGGKDLYIHLDTAEVELIRTVITPK